MTRSRTPNIAARLDRLPGRRLGAPVVPEDLLAYIAAVAAHPAYARRFQADLRAPGVRIPITTVPALWNEAAGLGWQVLPAHTYGRPFTTPDPAARQNLRAFRTASGRW